MSLPPKLSKVELDDDIKVLVGNAKKLYQEKLAFFAQNHAPPAYVVAAPGRVNLIGEHTDYTGGFVLPMAIHFHTVIYGTGSFATGKGTGDSSIRLRFYSDHARPDDHGEIIVEERRITKDLQPPHEEDQRTWANYVLGTVVQYFPDIPPHGSTLDLCFAITTSLPLGEGLSSSAALEVSVAAFVEPFLKNMAYSSSDTEDKSLERALRCQRAETDWALVPCGIMDQMVISKAEKDNLLLIDCRDMSTISVPMKKDGEAVIVITDSMKSHDIGDGEYAKRRAECFEALQAIQEVPLYHVLSLRDATMGDIEETNTKGKFDNVHYRRAKHVVTENNRTKEAKIALRLGSWDRLGELMNASHASLRDDFEVTCEELDFLVDSAQKYEGVFGSRMTGGGFGGCIVSIVKPDVVDAFQEHLKTSYKEKYGVDCQNYVTSPQGGVRLLAIDMDCKPAELPNEPPPTHTG